MNFMMNPPVLVQVVFFSLLLCIVALFGLPVVFDVDRSWTIPFSMVSEGHPTFEYDRFQSVGE